MFILAIKYIHFCLHKLTFDFTALVANAGTPLIEASHGWRQSRPLAQQTLGAIGHAFYNPPEARNVTEGTRKTPRATRSCIRQSVSLRH
jgi:hypothetical protein